MCRANATQRRNKAVEMTPISMDCSDEKTRPLHADAPKPPDFVHVIAPARLPAGYQFLAEVQGYDVKVVVVCFNGFRSSKRCEFLLTL